MADGSKERKKRTGTYFTHVALAYTSPRGLDAVREMHAKDELTRDTVKSAIKHLKDLGHEIGPLQEWYVETFTVGPRTLKPGEKRSRIVQQAKKGSPFVRTGLDPDRWKKGDTINEERTLDGRYILG